MSEDLTQRLGDGDSFEGRVLAALAAIRNQLTSIDGRMVTFGERMVSFEKRLTSVEERMVSFEGRLTSFEGQLTSLEARLSSLEGRLAALDEKVDARLRETRPIWEAVLARVELIDSKLDIFAEDMMDVRGEVNLLKKRTPPAA